jgi:hypothetical protein
MTQIERLALEIIAGLLLVWGTVAFLEHRGATACLQANTVATAKQEGRNEAQGQQDAKTITQEAQTHAVAISADPMPTPAVICVRQYASPGPLLSATATGPSGHGQAALSTADYRPSLNFAGGVDIGKPAAKIGQACDAQIADAQDYITNVCRPTSK